MDEVTFQDVLSHYQLKLKEIDEELVTLRNDINKMNSIIDGGWSSLAATACVVKLDTVNKIVSKTQAEISSALVELCSVEVPEVDL